MMERTRTGWLVISELVTREPGTVGPPGEPREWFKTERYMDYGEAEARGLFAETLEREGLVIA